MWHRYFHRLSGELLILFPFFALALLLFNFSHPPSQAELRTALLENPTNSRSHLLLAQELLSLNRLDEAAQELRFVPANQPEKVLLRDRLEEPQRIENQIHFWAQVANDLPHYRDAHLKLAILNWKIYRPFEAQKSLDAALEIDPNNTFITDLKRKLGS